MAISVQIIKKNNKNLNEFKLIENYIDNKLLTEFTGQLIIRNVFAQDVVRKIIQKYSKKGWKVEQFCGREMIGRNFFTENVDFLKFTYLYDRSN